MTKTEAKWSSRVSEWRASGVTAEEFALGKGFEGSTLRWWSSRLSREPRAASGPAVAIARVVRTSESAREPAVTIAVGEARVLVARGFDPELLRNVVAALRGAP